MDAFLEGGIHPTIIQKGGWKSGLFAVIETACEAGSLRGIKQMKQMWDEIMK
jgi:hypothetical protein